MTDTNQVPPAPAPVSQEVEEGKTFAILSYALGLIGIPFFLVPLIMRNNEFSLYHAKQCLLLWLGAVVASFIGTMLMAICIGFILLPVCMIFILVLDIMGLASAIKGEQKPVPLIGKYAEAWFKGLKKV